MVMSTQSSSFTVLSPDAVVEGKSIAQWTEDWWTWAAQSPAGTNNPLDDTTGAFAHQRNGNGSPVFFLAGTNGITENGGTAERTINVKAGTPILVPLINFADTLDPENVENDLINAWPSSVTDVFATIDGVSISNPRSYLETTDFFSMGRAKPNSLIAELGASAGVDLKHVELTPTKATGYYLMIDLSKGTHTIDFGGALASGFSTHVTDHIIAS
jgi:hypothetical protein